MSSKKQKALWITQAGIVISGVLAVIGGADVSQALMAVIGGLTGTQGTYTLSQGGVDKEKAKNEGKD